MSFKIQKCGQKEPKKSSSNDELSLLLDEELRLTDKRAAPKKSSKTRISIKLGEQAVVDQM